VGDYSSRNCNLCCLVSKWFEGLASKPIMLLGLSMDDIPPAILLQNDDRLALDWQL
jgi:hypothetical protein